MVFNYYWIQPSITITLYHMVFNTHPVENGSQHWIYVIHTPDAHMVLESARDVDLILFLLTGHCYGKQWKVLSEFLLPKWINTSVRKIYKMHLERSLYIIYIHVSVYIYNIYIYLYIAHMNIHQPCGQLTYGECCIILKTRDWIYDPTSWLIFDPLETNKNKILPGYNIIYIYRIYIYNYIWL